MTEMLARRARKHGLVYIEVGSLPIAREKRGRGFRYVNGRGSRIEDAVILERIRALVIPPAWNDVRIAAEARAHIQAVGRDAEGRLQYRYHDACTALRDTLKAERLARFGRVLPKIRARIEKDLRRRKADRRYAAAAATRLIDLTLIRSGHTGTEDGGRGATTLLKSDVKLNGTTTSLSFIGKSGKTIEKTVRDPILTGRLKKLRRIGRKRLFVFRDDRNRRCRLSARDLNAYLREASGRTVTAKDFRTFAASAEALAALCEAGYPETASARKRLVRSVVASAAETLVNTPAVARSSYVHPLVIEAFEAKRLQSSMLSGATRKHLDRAETALMRLLEEEFPADTGDA